ncbi:hypothetical protein POTOM_057442 [Populus tomentosa]|uniref:Cellulose synthase n=1 Tax=Populus tomentosa TaxID=118781 RepID=A0A8X7XYW4_POPTO|nr:hypothetical protein POTOM_057442 [Populus tomentosa]
MATLQPTSTAPVPLPGHISMEASAGLVAGSHNRNELVVIHGHEENKHLTEAMLHGKMTYGRGHDDEENSQFPPVITGIRSRPVSGEFSIGSHGEQMLSSSLHKRVHPYPVSEPGSARWDEKKEGGWKERMDEWKMQQGNLGPEQDDDAEAAIMFKLINMKGLDGIQGPVYVGTGCVFKRQALYGYDPPKDPKRPKMETCDCCPCFGRRKKKNAKNGAVGEGMDNNDKELLMSHMNFEKKFGQSAIFVTSTLMEEGGVPPSSSPAALLKEAIHVISCGYEDKTEWGLELGWIYGSITEDILTGFKMHCRGWRSIYCMPKRAAFKGSAPINLSDRLNQVLRWALGSVEIFFSRHSPMLYGYKEGKLKWLERFAYVNTTIYPFTSLALVAYCCLPAICLLTDKFIMPEISTFASLFFIALFLSIFSTGILELRWSGVSIEEWWRNEQFWVIGGVSAHLFAVVQGLLKVLAGIDTNFTVTSKATDDDDFGELYAFKWTTLLIPPTTILIINLVGVVAGVSDAINNGYQSWGPLFGKLFFAFWVIVHLYPFLKGLMGRQNRTPTIVVIWSVLLASIFSLLWVRIDPFVMKTRGPDTKQCGLNC